jgi:Tol biopolymer transport system component
VPDLRLDLQHALGTGYALERELGGGGMSRVFVAKETTLGRDIVVKVLPPDMAAGVSVERFAREIQLVARLQHPHIVPLLATGLAGGLPFYTMPFVRGDSLRARLRGGSPLGINEAVHILRDVAAALAYAHREGVVHRDIKPENIILSGGVAVVTDFGVAKALNASATTSEHDEGLTSIGVALGTPAYMSPEQASADRNVDHRADIYSFGCVAFELLTGHSPFAGRTPQQMLAAHVTEPSPDLARENPEVPPALARLVMSCLEKHPPDRPRSVDELLVMLEAIDIPSGGTQPTMARLRGTSRRVRRLLVAGTLVVIVAAFAAWLLRGRDRALVILSTSPVAVSTDIEIEPDISPDGRMVAFIRWTPEGRRVFVRQVDGERANPVTEEGNASHPRWSPDGSRIAFVADRAIHLVAATGGAPKQVVAANDVQITRPSWTPDGGAIVFARGQSIWMQPVAGGPASEIRSDTTAVQLHSPALSPDGRFIAYVEGWPLSLYNVSPNQVWIAPVAGGPAVPVSDSITVNVSPEWARDGRSVYFVSNIGGARDIYRVPIRNGRPAAAPTPVTAGGLASFTVSVSADGTRLAYDVVRNSSNIWAADIPSRGSASWEGATRLTNDRQHVESMRLSRDGRWLAYDSDRAGNMDIYKVRTTGGDPIQLTATPENEFGPSWSPDGAEIVFQSHRDGWRNLFLMSADGSNRSALTSGPGNKVFGGWSSDGRRIAYRGSQELQVIERDETGRWSAPPRIIAARSRLGGLPRWSPNRPELAYTDSDRIMVATIEPRGVRALAAPHRVGQWVDWSADGRTIFAPVNADGRWTIWAFPVTGGQARPILAEDHTHHFGREYFTTDGRRLYFTRGDWESDVHLIRLGR